MIKLKNDCLRLLTSTYNDRVFNDCQILRRADGID